jgi:hypothetical protein
MAPPPDQVAALMNELKVWCKAGRARQKELADIIGVSEQVFSNWLNLRKTPSLPYWFRLQDETRKIRRRERLKF